jgi:hypothetical protein
MLQRKINNVLAIMLLSSSAYAGEIKVPQPSVYSGLDINLKAYASFESGFSKQNNLKESEKNISANKNGFAFYNDAALYANISKNHEETKYGAKIVLVPTAKRKGSADYNGSHIFIESAFGRIELGSPIPVAANMMISDGSVPTKYIKKNSSHLKQDTEISPSFLTSDGCFIGDELTADLKSAPYSSEPPRTINYYTPKFALGDSSKLQVGISYTPDTANTGISNVNEKSYGLQKKTVGLNNIDRFEVDRSVKDAITAGILFEQDVTDNIGLKVAVTGEYGTAAGKAKKFINKDDKQPQEYKLADVKSYNIGGELQVSNFTFSSCYGSFGNSLTIPEFHKTGRKSSYYSLGTAYKYNNTTAKVTYFTSDQYKNKVSSIKLNVSHLLAKGLKPYAEISSYTLKGKPEFHNELHTKTTKGTVALVGVKLTL